MNEEQLNYLLNKNKELNTKISKQLGENNEKNQKQNQINEKNLFLSDPKRTNFKEIRILKDLAFSEKRVLYSNISEEFKEVIVKQIIQTENITDEKEIELLKNNDGFKLTVPFFYEMLPIQERYIKEFLERELNKKTEFFFFMNSFYPKYLKKLDEKKQKLKNSFFKETKLAYFLCYIFVSLLTCKHFEFKEKLSSTNLAKFEEGLYKFKEFPQVLEFIKSYILKTPEHYFIIEKLFFNFSQELKEEIIEIDLKSRLFALDFLLLKDEESKMFNYERNKVFIDMLLPEISVEENHLDKMFVSSFCSILPEEFKNNADITEESFNVQDLGNLSHEGFVQLFQTTEQINEIEEEVEVDVETEERVLTLEEEQENQELFGFDYQEEKDLALIFDGDLTLALTCSLFNLFSQVKPLEHLMASTKDHLNALIDIKNKIQQTIKIIELSFMLQQNIVYEAKEEKEIFKLQKLNYLKVLRDFFIYIRSEKFQMETEILFEDKAKTTPYTNKGGVYLIANGILFSKNYFNDESYHKEMEKFVIFFAMTLPEYENFINICLDLKD